MLPGSAAPASALTRALATAASSRAMLSSSAGTSKCTGSRVRVTGASRVGDRAISGAAASPFDGDAALDGSRTTALCGTARGLGGSLNPAVLPVAPASISKVPSMATSCVATASVLASAAAAEPRMGLVVGLAAGDALASCASCLETFFCGTGDDALMATPVLSTSGELDTAGTPASTDGWRVDRAMARTDT